MAAGISGSKHTRLQPVQLLIHCRENPWASSVSLTRCPPGYNNEDRPFTCDLYQYVSSSRLTIDARLTQARASSCEGNPSHSTRESIGNLALYRLDVSALDIWPLLRTFELTTMNRTRSSLSTATSEHNQTKVGGIIVWLVYGLSGSIFFGFSCSRRSLVYLLG